MKAGVFLQPYSLVSPWGEAGLSLKVRGWLIPATGRMSLQGQVFYFVSELLPQKRYLLRISLQSSELGKVLMLEHTGAGEGSKAGALSWTPAPATPYPSMAR